jgi:hypothetical protein
MVPNGSIAPKAERIFAPYLRSIAVTKTLNFTRRSAMHVGSCFAHPSARSRCAQYQCSVLVATDDEDDEDENWEDDEDEDWDDEWDEEEDWEEDEDWDEDEDEGEEEDWDEADEDDE